MSLRRPVHRPQERGIAVITAMLVVTIATVLAMELLWKTNLDLRRTEGLMARDQALEFAYYAEALASDVLQQDNDAKTVDCSQGWAKTRSVSIGQAVLAGGITDLQGRFNLNNLVRSDGSKPGVYGTKDELVYQQFQRLLRALDIKEDLADAVVDWIDPDTNASGFGGAEDDVYTSLQPPYRAANFWFTSVSELRAVHGIVDAEDGNGAEIYARLAPHVAALPVTGVPTLINVNTATPEVLMSLGKDISRANADGWYRHCDAERPEPPFQDLTQFTGFVDPAMLPYVGVTSNYFALQGSVSIGPTRLTMYSLLEHNGSVFTPRLRSFDAIEDVQVTGEPNTAKVENGKVVEDNE